MKLLQSLASIAIAVTAFAPASLAASDYPAHVELGRVIRSSGINVKINPSACNGSSFGWYWAQKNELVVCQENGRAGGPEVRWTEEDLDTLRHEAQHLIQDCYDGSRQGALHTIYRDVPALVKGTLSRSGIERIINSYASEGEKVVVLELEAFSVAALNDPAEQARDIQNYCFRP